MVSLPADTAAAGALAEAKKALFCGRISTRGACFVANESCRATGKTASWVDIAVAPPNPGTARGITGRSASSSLYVLTLGASRGLINVVDERMAASFRSSYRLGGYCEESEELMSRLMLMRRGEGASGGRERLPRCVGKCWKPAVTMTERLPPWLDSHLCSGEYDRNLLIKTTMPPAGRAVLKTRSVLAIPRCRGILV